MLPRLPGRRCSRLLRLARIPFLIGLYQRSRIDLKIGHIRGYGVDFRRQPLTVAKYVLLDPELDNFTYELANEDELVRWVAEALEVPAHRIERYVAEVHADDELLRPATLRRRWDHKRRMLYGRRLGWYALVRARRPEVVVETGIHDGMGSMLLLRALERNASEGHPGRLISVDISDRTGWLVPDRLHANWTRVIGATTEVLDAALAEIRVDMLIHDSDHTYECERFEFDTALTHRAPELTLVSDNSHVTSALRDVAAELGVEYHFFAERPARHFYPGAGTGLAVLSPDKPPGAGRPATTTRPRRASPDRAAG